MTLILTGLSPFGIAIAADSAATFTNCQTGLSFAKPKLARKLQAISYLNAGISCWGMGEIAGTATDIWIENFIDSHKTITALKDFANQFAKTLNAQLPSGNWLKQNFLFDFDSVEIVDATHEQVELFAIQIGNDTDEIRKKQYENMDCLVLNCELSENTIRILQRTFGKVQRTVGPIQRQVSKRVNIMKNLGPLVKVAQISNNQLYLQTPYTVCTDHLAIRMLLQAWRNLHVGLHFESLHVSAEEARALQQNATYYNEFDRVSRLAWMRAEFVSRGKYNDQVRKMRAHLKYGETIRLRHPQSRYALREGVDFNSVMKLAAAQVLSIVKTGVDEIYNMYQITFKDAAFFDFLRVGMAWYFYSQATLCPVCFCVESQTKIDTNHDFITETQDARNLSGTSIESSLYQCCVCKARWEQTEYQRHTDFTY